MIITVDGPAGTGKSTVARLVAEKLHFAYLNTGALYRAIALMIHRKKIDLADEKKIQDILKHFSFEIRNQGNRIHFYLDGADVTEALSSFEVSSIVSEVAALQVVRKGLLPIQRKYAQGQNVVFEGRDMGSVVFPDAGLKIFLTASQEVRAQRRFDEIREKFPQEAAKTTYDEVLSNIDKRDRIDSTRTLAPLKQPRDAFVIDTSHLSIEEVVDRIIEHYHKIT